MSDWVWIDERLVLAIHEQSLVRHGGAGGVRDHGSLQSALARPQQLAAYGNDIDAAGLAAALTAGLVKNHPFVDGNKRTGFVAGILFLELNGIAFTSGEETAASAILALAAGHAGEDAYSTFLRDNMSPADAG